MDIKTRLNQKQLVGERIRAARKAKNYTQSELQKLTGIQVSSISEFENGRSLPNIESMAKIAEKLEVSIDSLWYGDKSVAFIESAPNYGAKIVNAYAMLKACGVLKTFERDRNGIAYVSVVKHGGPLERLHASLDEFYSNYNTYSEPLVFEKQLKESVANSINNEVKQAEARRRMGL